MRENYQKKLDETLTELKKNGKAPKLLLHSCCAPCSSYVLEYLNACFHITVYYYNPNIYPETEFERRSGEQLRLIEQMDCSNPVSFLLGPQDSQAFYEAVKGLESIPEGGERCRACYRLRLEQTAATARERGFDYFTTTLSISPLKNAQCLNEIGAELAKEHGVSYLFSDFKKRDGYKRSIALSQTYGLYRQDYCGCVFSKKERELAAQNRQISLK